MTRRAGALPLALAAAVAVSLPFLAVRWVPVTDLPQLLAQIRLLGQALSDPGGPYEIRWLSPYPASYLLLGLSWLAAPPLAAGRIAMIALGLLWVAGVFLVASRRGRSPDAALLASLLFFSHPTLWGFYSFVFGFPVFLLFFDATSQKSAPAPPRTEALRVLGLSLLLYVSHVLWLLAAIAWLLAASLFFPVAWPRRRAQLVGALPSLALVAFWFSGSGAEGAPTPLWWLPRLRLTPAFWGDAVLGALRGETEPLLLSVALLFVLFGVLSGLREKAGFDGELLALAGALALVVALGPDKWLQTIELNTRWAPPAMAALLLGVPAPRMMPALRSALAVGVAVAFSLAVAAAFRAVERLEQTGLDEALHALPGDARVVGLDEVRESAFVKGRPFLQTFAWAQVLKGCSLSFSFAELPAPLVAYRKGTPEPPWTRRLEWFPERVTPADFLHFDYALVNGLPPTHRFLSNVRFLTPVTQTGRWRLYRTAWAGERRW